MAIESKIEWCDATINFWWGCTKVSPGCRNCYAEGVDARWGKGESHWGKGAPRRKIKSAVSDAFKLNRKAEKEGRRLRVFSLSMGDWLDPEVPIEWLVEMLDTIRQTPHLDWLLLTKRPELFRYRLHHIYCNLGLIESDTEGFPEFLINWYTHGEPPQNVWIGTSVEDQHRAEQRIPELLKIPAWRRFLSCEPLLGPVNLGDFNRHPRAPWETKFGALHWVIVGGESGPKARPMHPRWVRNIQAQCHEAGAPFFFKQHGAWIHEDELGEWHTPGAVNGMTGYERNDWEDGTCSWKVGKKEAGRFLCGREWSEFPESKTTEDYS